MWNGSSAKNEAFIQFVKNILLKTYLLITQNITYKKKPEMVRRINWFKNTKIAFN